MKECYQLSSDILFKMWQEYCSQHHDSYSSQISNTQTVCDNQLSMKYKIIDKEIVIETWFVKFQKTIRDHFSLLIEGWYARISDKM